MAYYKDFREYLSALEKKGKLMRIEGEVIRETEVAPLYWLQLRGIPEENLKCFLFEKVRDVKGNKCFRISLGHYDASREIAALGLMCAPEEINEKWHQAFARPIPPVIVSEGPVQEVVITGEELGKTGLAILPAPVENPGWSGDTRTTNQFITRDPETGIRNVGTYSGHITGPKSMRWGLAPSNHAYTHLQKTRDMGKKLQVAIVVGNTPNIVYLGAAPLPYGTDELLIAGGLAGQPVELVKCKTIDLEVPANAEIVIEGQVSNEFVEPKAAFGDYPGYMYEVENAYAPVIDVTCITHRRDPIFTATTVGLPIEGSSVLGSIASESMLYQHLKYSCYIPGVLDVASHISSGYIVVQIKKTNPWEPWQVLNALMGYNPYLCKIAIVVDEDIDPRDYHMVNWALSFSMQPGRDARIIDHRVPRLDPSAYPPGASMQDRIFPGATGSSALLIDATRKWLYTPVGLPRKDYMEKALKLWQEGKFPPLSLKKPWYGYSLGRWTEQDERNAELTLKGEHFKLGEEFKKRRKKI